MAGLTTGVVKKNNLKQVTVDTMVQESAVTFPPDVELLNRVCERVVKKLCEILGRAIRDVKRKFRAIAIPSIQQPTELAKRVGETELTGKNKVYSALKLEVECTSTGKARKHYEFGVNGAAVINRSNFVVDVLAFSDKPYDGQTLATQLGQVKRNIRTSPEEVLLLRPSK